MGRLRQHRDALALAVLAFALALAQRPGRSTSDTKIDLHVDPVGFLGDASSLWSPTGDLGHVQGGQYSGYLFPMGPFFALGRLAGLPEWLVHRLWLGTVLAIAVVGTVALVRALLPAAGAPARWAAGLLVLLNPYVVVFVNRTSITLLAYALLPWMLLAVHRGVRSGRSWWWPAALAVAVASAGGGVNVAVIGWLLLAPVALLVYEPVVGAVPWGAVRAFALRAAVCVGVTSLWWVAPVAAHALFGHDFLPFTEQPGVIWSTSSASEVLRLMGYWTTYIGVGYGERVPYTSDAGVLLFSAPVVVASLLVPAAAAAGLALCRRWTYAPFCLLLLLGGALIVGVGFPDGTPLRRAALAAYFHLQPIQFLRTTYKAAPLLVLAYALLVAAATGPAWAALRRAPMLRVAAAAVAVAVAGLSAYPLVRGQAIDSQLTWSEIPSAWQQAADDLDRELAPNTRALVLPGQLFGFNTWGATIDPILPTLADRPVAERNVVPYGDLRGVDLLWAVDDLVQQRRLLPGQLEPLLALLGVGAVVVPGDDDPRRSGAIGAGAALALLEGPGELTPSRRYGWMPTRKVPRVQRFDVTAPRAGGIVRTLSGRPTLVDGSASTLAGLAALGGLAADRPLEYAADAGANAVRDAVAAGADLVIGDGNARAVRVASRTRESVGATLSAAADIPPDAAVLNPVAAAGTDAQTVAVYGGGLRDVREEVLPGVAQYPQHRPFAAVDGDPATSWIAPPHVDRTRHWLELVLDRPRDIPYIDLRPHDDAHGSTREVRIGGRRWPLHAGWNRLPVRLRDVAAVRVTLTRIRRPPGVRVAPGGIDELRVPGLNPTEALRPPVLLERELRGADLRRSSLSYVFERRTGARPFRRGPATGVPQARRPGDRGDAEAEIVRRIAPPAERAWTADGWASVAPDAVDPLLDRLAGVRGGTFASSGRWQGLPGARASRAFDGDRATAWRAPRGRATWLRWTARRPATVRRLQLVAPAGAARPARVRVQGGPALAVGADGRVVLPSPVRGRTLRLDVLAAAGPERSVGIAEVRGAGVRARDGAVLSDRCGNVTADMGGHSLPLRVHGSLADLDAGRPLRMSACGPPVTLAAHAVTVATRSALWRPYWLRLQSRATVAPAPARGRQLVLAQSFDRGWRARCGGRDLGAPRPAAAFGNGWTAPADCAHPTFAYAPDRPVRAIMLVSGLLAALLVAFLVVRRRPRLTTEAPAGPRAVRLERPARASWPSAARAGLIAAVIAAGLIALRAGPPVFLVTLAVVRFGIDDRRLALGAAGLLGIAVPVTYVVGMPRDRGGFSFSYAHDLIAAHWLASAGLVLLALALWRLLSARRRAPAAAAPAGASRDRAAAPPDPARAV